MHPVHPLAIVTSEYMQKMTENNTCMKKTDRDRNYKQYTTFVAGATAS